MCTWRVATWTVRWIVFPCSEFVSEWKHFSDRSSLAEVPTSSIAPDHSILPLKLMADFFVVVLYSPMTSTRVNNTGRHGSSVTKRRPQSVWLIISVHTESILLHKSIPGLNSVRNASRSFQYLLLFFSFLVSPEPLIYFQVACAAICCITKLLRGPFCRQWRASCRLLCASCSAVGRGGRSAVLFSQKIGCRLFLAVFTRFSVDGSIWCANSPPD